MLYFDKSIILVKNFNGRVFFGSNKRPLEGIKKKKITLDYPSNFCHKRNLRKVFGIVPSNYLENQKQIGKR